MKEILMERIFGTKNSLGVCNIVLDRAYRMKWSAEAYSRVSAPVGSMGGKHASAPSRYQYLEESCPWLISC